MPLLNDVQAAGLTPTQLAGQITVSLKKFVTDPQVTVIVTQINSQRVYILGEVTRAGRLSVASPNDFSAGALERRRIHAICKSEENLPLAPGKRETTEISV